MASIVLSFDRPLIAFALPKVMTELSRIDATTVVAHYGAIIIMTFVVGIGYLISSFVVVPFKLVLCMFLSDMGLVAGLGLRQSKGIFGIGTVEFAIVIPLVAAYNRFGTGYVLRSVSGELYC